MERKLDFGERMRQIRIESENYLKRKKQVGFSSEERKAYYMGVGAGRTRGRAEAIRLLAKSMPPDVKESFLNGWEKGMLQATKK